MSIVPITVDACYNILQSNIVQGCHIETSLEVTGADLDTVADLLPDLTTNI